MTFVEVKDLRVELDGSGVDVVDGISFAIEPGEVVGLVGESGSGKTTIGVALLGDVRRGAHITGGTIVVDGIEVLKLSLDQLRGYRGNTVSYVPQDPAAALNPAIRIGKQLRELFEFHSPKTPADEVKARTRQALEDVRLPGDDEFLKRFPHQLSGGQQQRVTLAMAFMLEPKLIVLDEPTTGLDVTTQAQVLKIVRRLCIEKQVAALYVTHDLAVVANLADRILAMYAGRIVESGRSADLFASPGHPYTRRLMAAAPVLSERRTLMTIPGQAPAPGLRPGGCPFHPRCADAVEACATETPSLEPVTQEHEVSCLRAGQLATLQTSARDDSVNQIRRETAPLLEVKSLKASYGSREVLHDISFNLYPRECVAIVGESGSGKTTLSRALIGLHTQRQGEINFKGEILKPAAAARSAAQRQAIQYIFQSPYNSLNPRRRVYDILKAPLDLFTSPSRKEADRIIEETLGKVALSARTANQYPDQLSGGERQRVSIARALVCNPEVLICDEITSALDVSVQASIVRLLHELQENSDLALVFVTHNLALVRTVADSVVTLHNGVLVEQGETATVIDSPQHDYTRSLIADTPEVPEYA